MQPLAPKGVKRKQGRIEQAIRLAKLIKKESDQIFVLTGLLVSTDKFISEESAGTIRRLLDMMKVGRMLFEEGMEFHVLLDTVEEIAEMIGIS